ncbi:hypothetical protein BC835DRAFT_1418243 [Cytidiella melzeri]|nr:hypothetical protein BC835DRAFT_1418243 [Cytidiella melzeri]
MRSFVAVALALLANVGPAIVSIIPGSGYAASGNNADNSAAMQLAMSPFGLPGCRYGEAPEFVELLARQLTKRNDPPPPPSHPQGVPPSPSPSQQPHEAPPPGYPSDGERLPVYSDQGELPTIAHPVGAAPRHPMEPR